MKVETEVGLAAVREMVKVEGPFLWTKRATTPEKQQETAGGYIIRIAYIYIYK